MRLHASLYGKYNLGPWEFPKTNIFFCPQLDIFSDYVGRKYNLVDALGPGDEVFMIGRFIRDDSLLQWNCVIKLPVSGRARVRVM